MQPHYFIHRAAAGYGTSGTRQPGSLSLGRNDRLLGDGRAVGSRIGACEVYASLGIAHDCFSIAHDGRKASDRSDDVTAPREFLADRLRNASFHLNVTSLEGKFGESGGFQRHLNVHAEIDDIRDKL